MKKFEKAVTTVNATHITSATLRLVVTASAEHTPSICSPIGLFENIGLINMLFVSADTLIHPCLIVGEIFEERTETHRAHPKLDHIIDAAAGQ